MKLPSLNGKSKQPKRRPKKRKRSLADWPPGLLHLLDWAITFASVVLCLLLLPTRLPGMELLGIGPNWLLIWVVAWSINRSVWAGTLAGIILGLLQDAMTSPEPSHAITLGLVGLITGMLQKQRFIQEDFISIALIVFVMVIVADAVFGLLLTIAGDRSTEYIWAYYQRVTLASAILSSLWAPVLYYPLNRWWQRLKMVNSH
ncbi:MULTISPECIES: rod shape-determining protein MreD [unclassified Anabaena]|uniref:rod shape-determining protein MreD n=1 Tax=unclassified Anabaena TaxID=2619674 RepID=UPI000834B625|nr:MULTISPECIES: rod shape-determining protein MreD [unclassified Anabaena]